MAKMNFGGVIEEVMTREEFPLEKAREVLKDEKIAVIGYGVQSRDEHATFATTVSTSLPTSARARPSRKPSPTDGFRARHSSPSRKLPRRRPSSCASCLMRQ